MSLSAEVADCRRCGGEAYFVGEVDGADPGTTARVYECPRCKPRTRQRAAFGEDCVRALEGRDG